MSGLQIGRRIQRFATHMDPPLSFAFSGSGWLLPFHLGVIHELRVANLLTNQTHVSGTSGGALAALICVCDIDTEELLEKLVVLSETVSKQMRGEGEMETSEERGATHPWMHWCAGR